MKEVKQPKKPLIFYYLIVLIIIMVLNFIFVPWFTERSIEEVDYGTFISMTEDKKIDEVDIETQSNVIYFTGKDDKKVYKTAMVSDENLTERLYKSGAKFSGQEIKQTSPILSFILSWIIPILIFTLLGRMLANQMMKHAGGGKNSMMFGMGKSNAKIYVNSTEGIKFTDVAGEDEAKENLTEIVEYLHNPGKYKEIGASMPKGILLVGPPGTGKTMLAKAVAGEANVPFFSMSGSEFVEMFVGMGASKVRDLFQQAKEKAPCIVFIDEIDAIGKKRDGQIGGNDEREQTLNQLLVEMDGFTGNEGIIVMAATNRKDILDPALLRPGRFDRQIMVNYPDIKGREEILKIHTRNKPLAPDVSLKTIAQTTAGFTGAELENLANEAALLAARNNRKAITKQDIEEATIKVIAGPEKKSHVVTEDEKRLVAYHEAGHAVVTYYMPTQDKVHQVTIIPRGSAGGMTIHLPEKEPSLLNVTAKKLKEEIVVCMGGRVAEQLIIGEGSAGAVSDLQRSTKLAKAMITKYGFSEKLGPVVYADDNDEPFVGMDYGHSKGRSEKIQSEIDSEVRAIIDECYDRTVEVLKEHIDDLHKVAQYLVRHEKIDGKDFDMLMKGELVDEEEVEVSEEKKSDEIGQNVDVTVSDDTVKAEDAEMSEASAEEKSEIPDENTSEDGGSDSDNK